MTNSCVNPFSPKLDTETLPVFDLDDQSNIDLLFNNFKYAYSFRDTLIYGKLLTNDFLFTYKDYVLGVDVKWDREEEMKIHYNLFANAKRLDLIWNNIVTMSSDSTNVIRSFMLTITFNPTDIITIDGKVNLTLKKESGNWKIKNWIDESN